MSDTQGAPQPGRHAVRRLWPVALFVLVIFVSSSTVITSKQFVRGVVALSPFPLTQAGFDQFWTAWWWVFVKGWHATEFALVFLILLHTLPRLRPWQAPAIAALVGASDEIHQLSVPRRGAHLSDWLIDAMGILAAWGVLASRRLPSKQRWPLVALCAPVFFWLLWFLAVHPF